MYEIKFDVLLLTCLMLIQFLDQLEETRRVEASFSFSSTAITWSNYSDVTLILIIVMPSPLRS